MYSNQIKRPLLLCHGELLYISPHSVQFTVHTQQKHTVCTLEEGLHCDGNLAALF